MAASMEGRTVNIDTTSEVLIPNDQQLPSEPTFWAHRHVDIAFHWRGCNVRSSNL